MPLIIFHGDNKVLIGQKLSDLKSRFSADAISQFSLKTQSFEQVIVGLSTPSFFAEKRLVIIEEGDEKKVVIGNLPQDKDLTIVFVFGKELSSNSVIVKNASLRNGQIISFGQPQDKSIFQFLDLLAEKDRKAFNYFDSLLNDFGGQYLLTMIIFLLRRLVLPTDGLADFIARKTEKQRKNFSQKELTALYRKVLETEFKIKTGKVEERTEMLLLVNAILK